MTSNIEQRCDPEMKEGLAIFQNFWDIKTPYTVEDIPQLREKIHAIFDANVTSAPVLSQVSISEIEVLRENGLEPLTLRVYKPHYATTQQLPGILWIHGGGMIFCNAAYDDIDCAEYAVEVGAIVVSVEYRLAPEHPFPLPHNDCLDALTWLLTKGQEVGVKQQNVCVAGRSGGASLAASTVLRARDLSLPRLRCQLLIYPMLDNTATTSSAQEFSDAAAWGGNMNRVAWQCVLGEHGMAQTPSCYAIPARCKDFTNLPPTFIQVGALEIFRDESIQYAQNCMRAGVETALSVHSGLYHGGDMFNPASSLTATVKQERFIFLRKYLSTNTK